MLKKNRPLVGGLVAIFSFPRNIGLLSSSQWTNSYFSEGWPKHQPENDAEKNHHFSESMIYGVIIHQSFIHHYSPYYSPYFSSFRNGMMLGVPECLATWSSPSRRARWRALRWLWRSVALVVFSQRGDVKQAIWWKFGENLVNNMVNNMVNNQLYMLNNMVIHQI